MASVAPHQGYLPNGASAMPNATPGAVPLLPNQGRIIQSGPVRVLCVADVRGSLSSLNTLAKQASAHHVIHTGDFGFYDDTSLERIAEKTLKHVAQYSPLLSDQVKRQIAQMPQPQVNLKQRFPADQLPLSELPHFISGKYTLDVPVYTVWGACEDVRVLEKFRTGEYKVNNLHIIDEANSRLLDVGGVKLRLLGLGGAVVMHKLFDNGEGRTTIAGGQGTMWTTLLQMGELVDTANRVYDPTETRVFVTHASPAREGLLNQLSVTLKADFSISAGLHFRYGSSYNEFSVNPTLDHYRGKLAASKASFNDVWETVKTEVEPAVATNENQKTLLQNALEIVNKMPSVANGGNPFGGAVPGQGAAGQVDESAFKNMWNFNLADAAFGYLVLEIDAGRIGTEMRAQGFNFAHRGSSGKQVPQSTQAPQQIAPNSIASPVSAAPAGYAAAAGRPPIAPAAQAPQSYGQAAAQANRAPPHLAQQQQQQPKPVSAPAPVPAQPSPVPAATNNRVKTATPQPATTPAAAPISSPAPAPSSGQASQKANGTTPAPQASKPASPAVERPRTALFIHNLETEEAVRTIFSDEDKSKIQRVEKQGRNFVVHFANHEDAQTALDRQPQDHKKGGARSAGPGPVKPNVKFFDPSFNTRDRTSGGAGQWQASNRGNASAGQRGGYQSGASDSEGARGRGGFSGRGRGGGRADRGGPRGRGRGMNKGEAGGEGQKESAPAAAAAVSES